MDNIQEIWKDAIGFEGHYQVSNLGRIKSLKRKKVKILKLGFRSDGYVDAYLTMDGVTSTYSVHRIVAKAFVQNTENKPTVNHKNGITNDNRADNLEWATHLENNQHAVKILGIRSDTRPAHHKGNKLTPDQVLAIRESS